jgi:hypothetical protein
MFAAGCRSKKENKCTNFMGIVASMDWYDTSNLDYSNFSNLISVSPPLVYSPCRQQVRYLSLFIT